MQYKNKKGITLVEVLVTLGILLIVLTLCNISIKNVQKLIICNSVRSEEESMVDFIQGVRLECMEKNSDGEIIIDCMRDRFLFTLENKIIRQFECDNYIDLYGLNINGGEYSNFIKIRKDGYISPCSILFSNEMGEERRITTTVNLGYVQIK
ncbi:pilus assembly FimT family protein [Oceanirhabdus seepicola]|uniref:Prepilin-type N-terminal cleavage/methylation domain-containing protein n=1 Tax=Oceanirhabdus seepicola TaxID=2828781 RepID=A0A9J6PEH9_9CLOT|nr:prepilin-type N-terminal cleavage/methylation domain-containing protein [Oceanirhabdus seepicola]MCM1992728.1 prepilin-type N-terminal cleavage/methylation domain-containing protein [Oceanirhabdus seepicola]